MEYIVLDEVASTNTYCKEHSAEIEAPAAVRGIAQTAGRGQRGNFWEAAPGENLTFSIVWNPEGIAPRDQFAVSEAAALGVCSYLRSRGIEAKVKWPNDIYVGDRKICGILIEHSIIGMDLQRSVIGVGINVNQEEFKSDAPNPVSMRQLTGSRYDLEKELAAAVGEISALLESASVLEGREEIHSSFLASLWRGDGKAYPFRDRSTGKIYQGRIEDVEAAGYLIVRDAATGVKNRYAFKEVEFIL